MTQRRSNSRGKQHEFFMNKKRLTKEWLYFLGWFLFGLFVLPLLLSVLFSPSTHKSFQNTFLAFIQCLWTRRNGGLHGCLLSDRTFFSSLCVQ